MTPEEEFEEWYTQQEGFVLHSLYDRAKIVWLASRETAAKRCVEIVLSDDYVWRGEVAEAIEREFLEDK